MAGQLNRPAQTPAVTTLPTSPTTGQRVLWSPTGHELRWDGSSWQPTAPGLRARPYFTGVVAGRCVTVNTDVAFLTDPSTDTYVSGIVEAIIGTFAVIRFAGQLRGLSALSRGTRYYAGASGVVSVSPGAFELPVGVAESTDTLHVQLEAPV